MDDETRTYDWAGRHAPWPPRQGTITCTAAELARFVEEKFAAGWPVLSVRDGEGREVAGIGAKPFWWAPEAGVPGG